MSNIKLTKTSFLLQFVPHQCVVYSKLNFEKNSLIPIPSLIIISKGRQEVQITAHLLKWNKPVTTEKWDVKELFRISFCLKVLSTPFCRLLAPFNYKAQLAAISH